MAVVPDTSAEDVAFLALLVHRGEVDHQAAEEVMGSLAEDGLDVALVSRGGLERERVGWLRATEGGVRPLLPGYRAGALLGEGGQARVYEAHEEATGATVALKTLRPSLRGDASAVASFVEEGKLLRRLDHPGIVKVRRIAKAGDWLVLVMDRLQGETLLEWLEREGELAEETVLDILLQAARVLDHLRGEGVVHRDIKPSNLFLDADGRLILLDLGLAAAGGGGSEGTGVGTRAYVAPEQALGEAGVDARSDIYSLGATVYHLGVGEPPPDHLESALSSRALGRAGLSPHFHYFLEKMMAKDRDIRYPDPAALVADIERQRHGRDTLRGPR